MESGPPAHHTWQGGTLAATVIPGRNVMVGITIASALLARSSGHLIGMLNLGGGGEFIASVVGKQRRGKVPTPFQVLSSFWFLSILLKVAFLSFFFHFLFLSGNTHKC